MSFIFIIFVFVLIPFHSPHPPFSPYCTACAAAIANINLALCNTYIGSASEWYCGSAIDQDPGSILFQLISSSAIPSLLLSVWQTVVMPHALYSLTLVRLTCLPLRMTWSYE
jgi:hypothetical protein